ncbi:hypothetical protein V8F20_003660 [Naviculisporaceae sp. PSN 640]
MIFGSMRLCSRINFLSQRSPGSSVYSNPPPPPPMACMQPSRPCQTRFQQEEQSLIKHASEPHIPPTSSIQQLPFYDFQFAITSDLDILSPIPASYPDQNFQLDTTVPRDQQSAFSALLCTYLPPVANTFRDTGATWPADPQHFQLPYSTPQSLQQDPLTSGLSEASQLQISWLPLVTTGQPQPYQHNEVGPIPTPITQPDLDQGKSNKQEDKPGRLACPFMKKDLDRAWSAPRSCHTRYKKIKDVRLHLKREHEENKKTTRKANSLGTLTSEKLGKIPKYSSRGAGEQAHWYAIWDSIFPGLPKPASPYFSDDFTTELDEFQSFRRSQGSESALTDSNMTTCTMSGFSEFQYPTFPLSPLSPLPAAPESPATAGSQTDLLCNIDDAFLPQDYGLWHDYTEQFGLMHQGFQQVYQHPKTEKDGHNLDELARGWGPPW